MAQANDKSGKKTKSLPDFSLWASGCLQANQEEAASKPLAPGLYLVATPIGNLGDITLRALWTLQGAGAVLCEDTRVTGALLHRYGIKKPLIACHDHNEAQRVDDVLARLGKGEALALVSDAGTPMVSDPGYRLARACREAGHVVTAVPGASAMLTALAGAGLPSDKFLFVGFLPAKQAARRKAIADLAALQATLIFYESPQRLAATLADLAETLGSREAAVGRELTKLFEEMTVAPLPQLAQAFAKAETPKGENVILVAPGETALGFEEKDIDALLAQELETQSLRDAVAAVVKATGLKKSDVYQKALKISEQDKV